MKQFDFILMDLNMPIMNGKQCLIEIKKNPRLASIPIIIYTTSSYQRDIEELKQLGAAHFLIKPANIDNLVKILSGLFEMQAKSFSLS